MRSMRRRRGLYSSGEVTAETVESTHATCSISNGCSQATSLLQPLPHRYTHARSHTYCYNAVLISPTQSAAHLPVIDVKAQGGGETKEEASGMK